MVSEWLERWALEAPAGRALDLGAGEGETARWLAMRDFHVDAVDCDEGRFERLAGDSDDFHITPILENVVDFIFPAQGYALIVAQAVLHFLRPTALWPLADRIMAALIPEGLLIAEVFTTDDPGYAVLQAEAQEIEPNTFLAPAPIGILHYFAPGELRRTFQGLDVLVYEEARQLDLSSDGGYRAGAVLVARRPSS